VSARPFRFAADLHGPLAGRTWLDSARELEMLGFSTLFVPDHFDEGLGPIAAMAGAAAVTRTLKVAPLVFDCDYRHPAVLARELATIDMLSEGRLEVGLGAGWKRLDYDRAGITMDPPKTRVDRMIEHTQILKALFAEEPVTFEGEHYRITDLPGTPRPYTPGGPPTSSA
jgi:probable F420-dependent oxidoreductase